MIAPQRNFQGPNRNTGKRFPTFSDSWRGIGLAPDLIGIATVAEI
jgi:hypothetical protein